LIGVARGVGVAPDLLAISKENYVFYETLVILITILLNLLLAIIFALVLTGHDGWRGH
jgi:hypothetical protein